MPQHLVVGVYDAESEAAAAARELESTVPPDAITQHTKANFGGTDFSSANAVTHKRGFWGHLFGTTVDDDGDSYSRSIERGSTVLTVRVSEADVARVSAIMENYGPIDLDDESVEDLSGQASATDGEIPKVDGSTCIRCYVVEASEVQAEQQREPKL